MIFHKGCRVKSLNSNGSFGQKKPNKKCDWIEIGLRERNKREIKDRGQDKDKLETSSDLI